MTSVAAGSFFMETCSTTTQFGREVLAGLQADPKSIPATWLYDQRGSELFEEITRLPEYYLARAEIEILERHASDIGDLIGPDAAVVEFGSGSSRKTPLLLEALEQPALYAPLDIADDFMMASVRDIGQRFPELPIAPLIADFSTDFKVMVGNLPGRRKVGFFPGSTIGNFHPREAVRFLRRAANALGAGSVMLVGVDLQKDPDILLAAYNDSRGVTAAFNKNLLTRMNRELGANFIPDCFEHEAIYNSKANRIEMHLSSSERQKVQIFGQTFTFRLGETIHTENSYKYSIGSFQSLAHLSGWSPLRVWLDERKLFSLHYLVNKNGQTK